MPALSNLIQLKVNDMKKLFAMFLLCFMWACNSAQVEVGNNESDPDPKFLCRGKTGDNWNDCVVKFIRDIQRIKNSDVTYEKTSSNRDEQDYRTDVYKICQTSDFCFPVQVKYYDPPFWKTALKYAGTALISLLAGFAAGAH